VSSPMKRRSGGEWWGPGLAGKLLKIRGRGRWDRRSYGEWEGVVHKLGGGASTETKDL
jgi:hypothetical protein